jgi:hypothetical protein
MIGHLLPSKYRFRIIVDADRDGTWTTGDLFGHRQPERVMPHFEVVNLKEGWEQVIDFAVVSPVKEEKKPAKKETK